MNINSSLNDTFLALSDPTRRAILERLRQSEARVTELAEPFSISLNSVSKHIRILERAHLVERRKEGREHILRFRPASLRPAQKWITKQQTFWTAAMSSLDAHLKTRQKS